MSTPSAMGTWVMMIASTVLTILHLQCAAYGAELPAKTQQRHDEQRDDCHVRHVRQEHHFREHRNASALSPWPSLQATSNVRRRTAGSFKSCACRTTRESWSALTAR